MNHTVAKVEMNTRPPRIPLFGLVVEVFALLAVASLLYLLV